MLVEINAMTDTIDVSTKTAYKLGLLDTHIRLWKGNMFVSTLLTLGYKQRTNSSHISHIMQDWMQL